MKFMWQSVKNHHTEKNRRNHVFCICSVLFATGLIFSACIPPWMKEPQPYNWYNDAVAVHFLQQSLQLLLHAPQPFSKAKMNWKAHVLTSADCKPNHHAVTPISKHGWHLLFVQLKEKTKLFNRMVHKMLDSLISKVGESQIPSVTAWTIARKQDRKKTIHGSCPLAAGFSVLSLYSLYISSHQSSHTLPPTFLFPKQHKASYRLNHHAKKNITILN